MKLVCNKLFKIAVLVRLCPKEPKQYDLSGPSSIRISLPGVTQVDAERRKYVKAYCICRTVLTLPQTNCITGFGQQVKDQLHKGDSRWGPATTRPELDYPCTCTCTHSRPLRGLRERERGRTSLIWFFKQPGCIVKRIVTILLFVGIEGDV